MPVELTEDAHEGGLAQSKMEPVFEPLVPSCPVVTCLSHVEFSTGLPKSRFLLQTEFTLMTKTDRLLCVLVFWLACQAIAQSAEQTGVFKIRVVDDQTGRGVPLVELKSVTNQRFFTDSAGLVAIREPELFGQTVFFHVSSHGYEFPKDGFGYRGKQIEVKPNGEATLKIKRLNIAERLYRVTGAGIYSDSVLLGEQSPIEEPLLNAQVSGSDSVVTAIYHRKLHWFWGDTNRPKYPLGLFDVPGATSNLPNDCGLNPSVGVNLNYFVGKDGFAKAMCKMPGDGPTWIWGLTVLRDSDNRERMCCGYMKVRNLLDVYERGIAEFDDDKQEFVRQQRFDKDVPLFPDGHSLIHKVDGVEYVYFAEASAMIRVRATVQAFCDLSQYEGFSCLVPGGREQSSQVERDSAGKVVWAWKRDTAPIRWSLQATLLKSGQLKPNETWLNLKESGTGKPVIAHAGSVTWNEHRRRWVSIFTQHFGTSLLGEIWYSEAIAPEGPWRQASKILTHDKYSFYNPKQHPYFSSGRSLYFEGTYTHSFSGNSEQTPKYDYNQIMYRLDLDDSRLAILQKAE